MQWLRLRIPLEGSSKWKYSYTWLILLLIGHLAGTALVSLAFITLVWGVTYFLSFLHSLHPFPNDLYNIVTKMELGGLYADALITTMVLLAGIWRFLKDIRL